MGTQKPAGTISVTCRIVSVTIVAQTLQRDIGLQLIMISTERTENAHSLFALGWEIALFNI